MLNWDRDPDSFSQLTAVGFIKPMMESSDDFTDAAAPRSRGSRSATTYASAQRADAAVRWAAEIGDFKAAAGAMPAARVRFKPVPEDGRRR